MSRKIKFLFPLFYSGKETREVCIFVIKVYIFSWTMRKGQLFIAVRLLHHYGTEAVNQPGRYKLASEPVPTVYFV